MENKFTKFLKSPVFKKILVTTALTAAAATAAAAGARVLKNRAQNVKGMLPKAKNVYISGGSIASLAFAAYLIKDGGYDGSSIHIYGAPQTSLDEEYGSIGGLYYKLMKDICASDELGMSICDVIDNNSYVPEPTVKVIDGSLRVHVLDITPDRDTLRAINRALKKLDELDKITVSEYFRDLNRIFDTDLYAFIEMSFGIRDEHMASELVKRAEQVLTESPSIGFYDTLYYDFSTSEVLGRYLEEQGVDYHKNAEFTGMDIDSGHVNAIHITDDGTKMIIYPNPGDKVVFTAGNILDNTSYGTESETAPLMENEPKSLPLWAQAAVSNDNFGIPELLLENVGDSMEFSFISEYLLNKICGITGETAQNGVSVLLSGSNWRMKLASEAKSTIEASQEEINAAAGDAAASAGADISELTEEDMHSAAQKAAKIVESTINVKGMYCSSYGNFVQKPMRECNGTELLYELCGHLGIIDDWEKILADTEIIEVVNYPYKTAPLLAVPEHTRPEKAPCGNCLCIGAFMQTNVPSATLEQEIASARNAAYELIGLKEKKGFMN